MRVMVCDDHVVFAESFAHLLQATGLDVAGVTYTLPEAVATLRREQVDVCLLDVMFGSDSVLTHLADLRNASPRTRLVLLSGHLDNTILSAARAAGVRGVADKWQPISEIVAVVQRVHAGESVLPAASNAKPTDRSDWTKVNDARRLAAYLTSRERQVVSALVCGVDTGKLARSMGIAEATARCHIQSVLSKLGAHSRLEAATAAVRYGLVDPETGKWLMGAV